MLCALQARYRPGLPAVLKGVSFTIPSGSKYGVVGRTGSGKSSLLLALYELIEVTAGTVRLDGVDVAKVRSRLHASPATCHLCSFELSWVMSWLLFAIARAWG